MLLSHGLIVDENRLCTLFEPDFDDDGEEVLSLFVVVRRIDSEKLQNPGFLVLLLSFHSE